MIDAFVRKRWERILCGEIKQRPGKELVNDDTSVCGPLKVGKGDGNTILLCGKRRSMFPFHCMVGPDWPALIAVYGMIFIANGVVLGIIDSLPILVIGVVGCGLLLLSYTFVVCSDPGIVYQNDFPVVNLTSSTENDGKINEADPEDGLKVSQYDSGNHSSLLKARSTQSAQSGSLLIPPNTIECGQCEIQRPIDARHCHYCGVCVEELDHHCPWCGKCIGKNNIFAFRSTSTSKSCDYHDRVRTMLLARVAASSACFSCPHHHHKNQNCPNAHIFPFHDRISICLACSCSGRVLFSQRLHVLFLLFLLFQTFQSFQSFLLRYCFVAVSQSLRRSSLLSVLFPDRCATVLLYRGVSKVARGTSRSLTPITPILPPSPPITPLLPPSPPIIPLLPPSPPITPFSVSSIHFPGPSILSSPPHRIIRSPSLAIPSTPLVVALLFASFESSMFPSILSPPPTNHHELVNGWSFEIK